MRRLGSIAVAGLSAGIFALAACTPPKKDEPPAAAAPQTPASATTTAGCAAKADRIWKTGAGDYAVSIVATGETCEAAMAKLTVTAPGGAVVFTKDLQADQTFGLKFAKNKDEMQKALADAITDPSLVDTSNLPAWEKGADQPGGEFPFYPADDINRSTYEKLRAGKMPMFCYVQGGESSDCLILDGDKLKSIGAQSFPG